MAFKDQHSPSTITKLLLSTGLLLGTLIPLLAKLFNKHQGELLAFFMTTMTNSTVAPATGTHTLKTHVGQLATHSHNWGRDHRSRPLEGLIPLDVRPMYSGMIKGGHSRRVEVRVQPDAFAPGVQLALERLGYKIVYTRSSWAAEAPDTLIVAAEDVSQLEAEATAPIILIGTLRSRSQDDPRVIGAVSAPAELLGLYSLLQRALEAHPRAVPRIETALPARSLSKGVDTPGAILSLSEKGCLLRSTQSLSGRGPLHLQFTLPGGRAIYTQAKPCYLAGKESGMVFEKLPEASRVAITEFVTSSLSCIP
jgi:hypothetical protein